MSITSINSAAALTVSYAKLKREAANSSPADQLVAANPLTDAVKRPQVQSTPPLPPVVQPQGLVNSGSAYMGNLNGDGKIDIDDLMLMIGEFGKTDSIADLNCDGKVDGADLSILQNNWGDVDPNRIKKQYSGHDFGDINGDGQVNVDDLLQVINHWGKTDRQAEDKINADINGDGVVDEKDMHIVMGYWHQDVNHIADMINKKNGIANKDEQSKPLFTEVKPLPVASDDAASRPNPKPLAVEETASRPHPKPLAVDDTARQHPARRPHKFPERLDANTLSKPDETSKPRPFQFVHRTPQESPEVDLAAAEAYRKAKADALAGSTVAQNSKDATASALLDALA